MTNDLLLKELIKEELIFVKTSDKSLEEVIRNYGEKMVEFGVAKPSYPKAVLEREKNLPTGLNLMGEYGIAIPHTDPEHVNKSALSIITLKEPVEVHSMINPEDILNTKLIIMLSIKEPEGQIEILKQLMSLFREIELMREIESANSKDKIIEMINNKLDSKD